LAVFGKGERDHAMMAERLRKVPEAEKGTLLAGKGR